MALTINILVIVLLCCSIVAVIRLWSVLGSARTTLANLEETRLEANETLKLLSEVAASTDKVMREEVAPTLQKTRATLDNVEMTTRALARTTQSLQRLTGHAENLSTAQKLLAMGGTIAQNVFAGKANREAVPASASASAPTGVGLAFAVVSRLRGLLARRKQPDKQNERQRLDASNEIPVLPASPQEQAVLTVGKDTTLMLSAEPKTRPTSKTSRQQAAQPKSTQPASPQNNR